MNRLVTCGLRAARRGGLALAVALAIAPLGAVAQQSFGNVVVVGNDRGGYVGQRATEIDWLRAQGSRVEIRGNICYSTCTMYLGAGDVCVSPATTFGFHGPSRNGSPLPPQQFDHWSQVMARYYPAGLREWFMATGRYEQTGLYRISGSELIRMGLPSC